ncbi:ribosomal protein S27 [Columba livia]|uniref:Ribosomal protein S27 n=1 Tax=Columba livia TaxID=8932 RepID=A0A2I0LJP2_COLLI|nr:ribosomal protein S27 [Columba livia]
MAPLTSALAGQPRSGYSGSRFRFSPHTRLYTCYISLHSPPPPKLNYIHYPLPSLSHFLVGCYKITTVFSHAQTVVLCVGCSTVLCQPTGGKARLTEGCSFRRKQH